MNRRAFLVSSAALSVAGCAGGLPVGASLDLQIAELAEGLMAMGSDISPTEAKRAAQVSYNYAATLTESYGITDGPLVHNRKVNQGERPRGLCKHWAEDMSKRLARENFKTLDVTRAIAHANHLFRLEHSTAVLTPHGATMEDGMVIDPWRYGGRLYWGLVKRDARYDWRPRREVLLEKQERRLAEMAK